MMIPQLTTDVNDESGDDELTHNQSEAGGLRKGRFLCLINKFGCPIKSLLCSLCMLGASPSVGELEHCNTLRWIILPRDRR